MGLDWPIISLKLSIVIYQFIAFFKTVFGWEHLGKVPKQLFGNIYFWGITVREVQRLINVIIIHSKKISCFWLVKTIFTITSCCWSNLVKKNCHWTDDVKTFCHIKPMTSKWLQKCSLPQVIEPLTIKIWERGCVISGEHKTKSKMAKLRL